MRSHDRRNEFFETHQLPDAFDPLCQVAMKSLGGRAPEDLRRGVASNFRM
jgi:hypothetical protein